LGGLAGFLFGAADGLFFALVAFAVLDYVSGVVTAVINRRLSSRVGFDGIVKKIMLFVLVALANIIDIQVLGNTQGVLRSAVIAFLLANEGLSVLENVSAAGLPIPAKLKNILSQLKESDSDE
jgi:toxin secretion/phage lysis holin